MSKEDDILWDTPLGWTPFGQDVTCGEWHEICAWYVAKTALDTEEES